MPWKTLCKLRTALPWGLWSIISSSSVIYIPAPLCCGKREETFFFFFVFHLIVDRLTLWPVLLVSVRKRIFSPSYLKMKFQGESKRSFSSFHSKQCLHSKRGEDEKQEQRFFKCRRRALQFLKRNNSTALTDIIQWDLWWGFFKTQWRHSALASVEPRSGLQPLALTRRAGPCSWKRGRKTGPSC